MPCFADDAAKVRLQHYIAARQQNSFGSSEAANTTFTGSISSAHQLHIQPLCLTGSPTASSSHGIASSGNPSVSAVFTSSPGGLSRAAAHAHFFLPGFKAGQFQAGPGQDGAGQPCGALEAAQLGRLTKLSSLQGGLPPDVSQLLEGAVAARARLEPKRMLTDKENSACMAFDEMSMGRQEASSHAEAASRLTETASALQQHVPAEHDAETSHGRAELHSKLAPQSVNRNKVKVASDMNRSESGKLESENSQGRIAARRIKLHAMLENL